MAEGWTAPAPGLVLAVNAGSSSLKLTVLDGQQQRLWQDQHSWNGGFGAPGCASSNPGRRRSNGSCIAWCTGAWPTAGPPG